ncbi:ANTAR domain-containing response regulator [Marinicrinis sediminis]|uniref:ANTAR domain-containing response regulator n=1 Tax=Marinicrinis sediminis TaxID=1652465 RepID=A0ABW5R6X7_9BACL
MKKLLWVPSECDAFIPDAVKHSVQRIHILDPSDSLHSWQHAAEMCIFQGNLNELLNWLQEQPCPSPLPICWWCDEYESNRLPDLYVHGMLTSEMSLNHLRFSMQMTRENFFREQQLRTERDELMYKFQERKWVDQAKGILIELKNCSESEAYQLLRKQAMNERKKMMDIAKSIVNAYELIHKQS